MEAEVRRSSDDRSRERGRASLPVRARPEDRVREHHGGRLRPCDVFPPFWAVADLVRRAGERGLDPHAGVRGDDALLRAEYALRDTELSPAIRVHPGWVDGRPDSDFGGGCELLEDLPARAPEGLRGRA